jgi:hypothetical protein
MMNYVEARDLQLAPDIEGIDMLPTLQMAARILRLHLQMAGLGTDQFWGLLE